MSGAKSLGNKSRWVVQNPFGIKSRKSNPLSSVLVKAGVFSSLDFIGTGFLFFPMVPCFRPWPRPTTVRFGSWLSVIVERVLFYGSSPQRQVKISKNYAAAGRRNRGGKYFWKFWLAIAVRTHTNFRNMLILSFQQNDEIQLTLKCVPKNHLFF